MPLENYDCEILAGDNRLPMIVCIHGYCQGAGETWTATIQAMREQGVRNTILLIDRVHGEYCGRMSLEDQLQELRNYVQRLCEHNTIGSRVIWLGHSLGGLLAQDLAATFTSRTAGVIAIAPAPLNGWWVLSSWRFWLYGGLLALPATLYSIWTGRGVRFSRPTVRGLFMAEYGDRVELERFYYFQRPDSAWMFLNFLLWYWAPADTIRRLRLLAEEVRCAVIGCTDDNIIPALSLRHMAYITKSSLQVVPAPHCWWLDKYSVPLMASVIQQKLEQMR